MECFVDDAAAAATEHNLSDVLVMLSPPLFVVATAVTVTVTVNGCHLFALTLFMTVPAV